MPYSGSVLHFRFSSFHKKWSWLLCFFFFLPQPKLMQAGLSVWKLPMVNITIRVIWKWTKFRRWWRWFVFSKSVLDIRTRLVVTVEPETKWMPNSDSASKLMPKCKILGKYDLPNYSYSCLKMAFFWDFYMASPYENELGGKSFPQICFHMESACNSWKIWWF